MSPLMFLQKLMETHMQNAAKTVANDATATTAYNAMICQGVQQPMMDGMLRMMPGMGMQQPMMGGMPGM